MTLGPVDLVVTDCLKCPFYSDHCCAQCVLEPEVAVSESFGGPVPAACPLRGKVYTVRLEVDA